MISPKTLLVSIITVSLLTGTLVAVAFQERKPRKVTRVKRPTFSQRDWDGIYFENLFEEGLVGDRPSPAILENAAVQPGPDGPQQSEMADETPGTGWSSVIDAAVVEDEVKALQQQLSRDITTPGKFKTEYAQVRQSYAVLSMLFAIIREYDGDVRWKEFSVDAQAAMARAAAGARVGSSQAYENAKRRRDELIQMVRGGNFETTEKGSDEMDWYSVIDRSPSMVRLQESVDRLKPAFANKTEYNKALDLVHHEANMVAAIGKVLIVEGMDEWDEDDYAAHAVQMTEAARMVVQAAKNQNYEMAQTAFNQITQSCSNCHDSWR